MSTRKLLSFSAQTIGEEVDKGRRRVKWTVERTVQYIGWATRTYWYAKKKGTTPFSIDEVGALAAAWNAPRGWPVIPWDEAFARETAFLAIEALNKRDLAR